MSTGCRIKLQFDKAIVGSELSKTWYLIPKSVTSVGDLMEDVIKAFRLEETCDRGILFKLDNFVVLPDQSIDIVREGDCFTVHKREDEESKTLKRKANNTWTFDNPLKKLKLKEKEKDKEKEKEKEKKKEKKEKKKKRESEVLVQNSVIEASVVASPPSHTPEASKESERKKKEKRKEKQKRKSKDKDKKAVVSEGFTSNNLASPASPALSPTPATPTTPATRPSLPPTPFGVGSTSSVGPTLTGTPTTSSYLSPLKSVSQKSNVASSTISANSTAPTLSPRSQPQKHILFDPEEGEVPDAQPTDSQPQQGPPEGGSQVLRTSVFLRPAPRPTIENWKSSGWRTYSGYSKQMQRKETKEQSEKGKRKRSRGNKQGSLQHTDNQQSQAEEANHTASCQTTSIGGNENEPAMEVSVKDYESFPKLDAPSVGICLAYKILEVSSSWRPEVSDWKEAKVISLNEQGTILTLEHLNLPPPPPPETEEEEEVVETTWDVNWSEMQDVRLINK